MYLFWDWNGTLLNDVQLNFDTVNRILRKRGRNTITMKQYYSFVETPIIRFYEHLFDFRQVSMEEIARDYYDFYHQHQDEAMLAENGKEVLREMQLQGAHQYLLTASHKDSVLPKLESFGISEYFDGVLAADDWYATSKSERARNFLEEQNICPDDCWFIGDQVHDAETADFCGGRCILIPDGHQLRKDLEPTGAVILEHIDRIPEFFIQRIF